ncbi:hypothetical protein CDA63_20095 [Hymenobacter amundsenii]|uniref:DUF6630 domain-containing protein n=1 Tax=Hymenobacter amundsenii TaxID=2006685 RepID=A0A246FFM1_9BACT|nr:hypothetical protein [Hymenobacter amundsenii]OWP61313.1 hypothetical protein CDA63_20095 [Hymenobacter amundsenii]
MHADLSAFLNTFAVGDTTVVPRLVARLSLVLTDPAEYAAHFADDLAEGVIDPQELRDLALIDSLLAEDLAVECDWQETAGQMAESLNYVLTQQGRKLLVLPLSLGAEDELGPERLDILQDALEPLGLALVLFALDGDSYPLSVVAQDQSETLLAQAQKLGFKLHTW